jgi:hypothetical protein
VRRVDEEDVLGAELAEHPLRDVLGGDPLGADLAATGYPFDNNFYEHVDAEVAYAMVRRLRPARVVELGSGWSTRVLRAALAANGSGEHRGFDPFTTTDGVEAVAAQDVPEDVFAALCVFAGALLGYLVLGGDASILLGCAIGLVCMIIVWNIRRRVARRRNA